MSRRGALVATLAALALAGCGSDDDPERGTLAALAPDDATVYTEAVLRPEGEMRDALESSLSLLLDTDDPGGLITDELNQAFAEDDEEVSYEGDIEPWLGERGAIFFTELFPDEHAEPAFGDEGERGAIVLEVTDADAAQALIDKAAEEEGSTEAAEYEGVEYTLFDGRVGAGLVGDRTVVADEETLQRVVDTEGGGPSLAGDEEFEDALDGGAETAASLFVDVPSLVEGADAAGQLTRSEEEALDTAFAGLADEPVGATVDVSPNGFGLEVSHGSAELPFLSAAGGSALLRELPDDTWLAAGFKDLGEGFNAFLGRAEDFGVGGVEIDRAEREFMREYGLPLEELYAPLGDGALFASGRGVFGTGGGLVVETDDPGETTRVLQALRRGSTRPGVSIRPLTGGGPGVEGFSVAIPDAPSTLNFVASGDRLVIAYGEGATTAALEPGETLAESEEFRDATAALGDGFPVGLFLDFGPVTELLGAAAAADPSIDEALPYLEAIDFLIGGSAAEGGRDRLRIFIGLEEDVSGPAT